jgi:hypothetical protein
MGREFRRARDSRRCVSSSWACPDGYAGTIVSIGRVRPPRRAPGLRPRRRATPRNGGRLRAGAIPEAQVREPAFEPDDGWELREPVATDGFNGPGGPAERGRKRVDSPCRREPPRLKCLGQPPRRAGTVVESEPDPRPIEDRCLQVPLASPHGCAPGGSREVNCIQGATSRSGHRPRGTRR